MLLDFFPRDIHPNIRPNQTKALEAIDRALEAKMQFIVLDLPVGVGKSDLAITLARWTNDAFIVTPTKALQLQYKQDFEEVKVMSGRRAYPCTYQNAAKNKEVIATMLSGKPLPPPATEELSCAKGACVGLTKKTQDKVIADCSQYGHCPYEVAIDEASKFPIMIQNLHSFFFQTSLFGKFSKRKILIIDEAHDLESFLRDQVTTRILVMRDIQPHEYKHLQTLQQWINWFKLDDQFKTIPKDDEEKYLARIEKLEKFGEKTFNQPIISRVTSNGKRTRFEFIPNYVGNIFHEYIAAQAEIVVFMSGTIFNPKMFLSPLGISTDDASYIRIDSDFPPENRPVVLPRNRMLDLSHKGWQGNVSIAMKEIKNILNYHSGQKGMIHTTSYQMSNELQARMPQEKRLLFHDQTNFAPILDKFFNSKEDSVLVSPCIQQGIDAYGDRAQFQILIRPQNLPTTDPWVESIIKSGRWDIYFYKSLIVFAQQLGRPVRSSTDKAVTYLLSSTYLPFIEKTKRWMPQWLKNGFKGN